MVEDLGNLPPFTVMVNGKLPYHAFNRRAQAELKDEEVHIHVKYAWFGAPIALMAFRRKLHNQEHTPSHTP